MLRRLPEDISFVGSPCSSLFLAGSSLNSPIWIFFSWKVALSLDLLAEGLERGVSFSIVLLEPF